MSETAAGPIEPVVQRIVAEALNRTVEEARFEANLMDDLGATSLDFLDIVFQIERAFGIQITRGEMERAARGTMSDDEFAPGGLISEAGHGRLRELMPEAAARIKPGLRAGQILGLFSVQTFVNMVRTKLGGR